METGRRRLSPREELIWDKIHARSNDDRKNGDIPIEEMDVLQVIQRLEAVETTFRESFIEHDITKTIVKKAEKLLPLTNFDMIGRQWDKTGFADLLRGIIIKGGRFD